MLIIILILADTAITAAGLKAGLSEANKLYAHYNTQGITTADWNIRLLLGTMVATGYWVTAAALRKGKMGIIAPIVVIATWGLILGEAMVVLMNALQLAAALP